jgi:acetyltransferase-like isoleucine patch superfamily enzyme
MGFGSYVSKIDTEIGHKVMIGGRTIIGLAKIDDNAAIANYVCLLSGRRQHNFDDASREIGDETRFESVRVGRNTFIGDQSVIMADVGECTIVGAGSVIPKPLPAYAVAVGNPARVVKERSRQSAAQREA